MLDCQVITGPACNSSFERQESGDPQSMLAIEISHISKTWVWLTYPYFKRDTLVSKDKIVEHWKKIPDINLELPYIHA